MVDYYEILKIKPTASTSEIKSAYRRLARKMHPDVNGGSERAAKDFALIALAYRTLINPTERAYYDSQRDRLQKSGGSVIHSDNPHARRMRRVAVQARWDAAVDRWIEAERKETFARTQAVFTTVTLFLSTFIVAMFKPRFWPNFDVMGRAVLITLFLIGLWHLAARLRASFERYTYTQKKATGDVKAVNDKPFTRAAATAFLVLGYIVSAATGLFVGEHFYYVLSDLAHFFDQQVRPDLLIYPPIAVLIIDAMHAVASKID